MKKNSTQDKRRNQTKLEAEASNSNAVGLAWAWLILLVVSAVPATVFVFWNYIGTLNDFGKFQLLWPFVAICVIAIFTFIAVTTIFKDGVPKYFENAESCKSLIKAGTAIVTGSYSVVVVAARATTTACENEMQFAKFQVFGALLIMYFIGFWAALIYLAHSDPQAKE